MNVPVEISYRDVPKTPALEDLIREKCAKLEEVCDYISSCRVTVEQPEKHQRSGRPYRVRLEVSVPPGHRVVVDHEPVKVDRGTSVETDIRHAFGVAMRELKKLKERQRREVKVHEERRTEAVVTRVLAEQGFGFLETTDGRQIYFHRNSVANEEFERLQPGMGVHYVEEQGQNGPQAVAVWVTEKPGPGVKHSEERPT